MIQAVKKAFGGEESVAGILSTFTATINRLERHNEDMNKKADEAAKQIVELTEKKSIHEKEALHAVAVAGRLKKLLSDVS